MDKIKTFFAILWQNTFFKFNRMVYHRKLVQYLRLHDTDKIYIVKEVLFINNFLHFLKFVLLLKKICEYLLGKCTCYKWESCFLRSYDNTLQSNARIWKLYRWVPSILIFCGICVVSNNPEHSYDYVSKNNSSIVVID